MGLQATAVLYRSLRIFSISWVFLMNGLGISFRINETLVACPIEPRVVSADTTIT